MSADQAAVHALADGAGRPPVAGIQPTGALTESPAVGTGRPVRAMRVTAVFAASRDQVAQARYFAEAMLAGWPVAVADDLVLIVSELATNAVVHSVSRDGGQFWVHVETVPGEYVWVEVRDEGGPWTRWGHRDGRPHGLDIVAELAADFGVDGDARTGRIVWARLDLPKPSAPARSQADVTRCVQPAAGLPVAAERGSPQRGLAAAGSSRRGL